MCRKKVVYSAVLFLGIKRRSLYPSAGRLNDDVKTNFPLLLGNRAGPSDRAIYVVGLRPIAC